MNRENRLGASDAPTIILGELYGKSSWDLWLEKRGEIEPEDLSDNPDVRRGTLNEDLAVDVLRRRYGASNLLADLEYTHPGHQWLVVHPDVFVNGALCEVKCPRPGFFRGDMAVKPAWVIQLHAQAAVMMVNNIEIVNMFVFAWDAVECQGYEIPVSFDLELAQRILSAMIGWWGAMQRGEYVEVHQDFEFYFDETPIDRPRVESLDKAIMEIAEIRDSIATLKREEEELRRDIDTMMANQEIDKYSCDHGSATLKEYTASRKSWKLVEQRAPEIAALAKTEGEPSMRLTIRTKH